MEPEAQRIIAENLHRDFIDHAEYPVTAEIEQRRIRMLANLFHVPGETTGARTQGSSEAIMLGAMSLKWNWRQRMEKAGKDTTKRLTLVFGGSRPRRLGDPCCYFYVEAAGRAAEAKEVPHRRRGRGRLTWTRTRSASPPSLPTTFTGHADDFVGINDSRSGSENDKGSTCSMHIDGASGGFVRPFAGSGRAVRLPPRAGWLDKPGGKLWPR